MHTRRAPSSLFLSLSLFLSVSHPSELGILTWESPPLAIFISRFGDWYPLLSFTLGDGQYPRGFTESAWQHNGHVEVRVAPSSLVLSLVPLLSGVVYVVQLYGPRTRRSKLHPRLSHPPAISLLSRAINRPLPPPLAPYACKFAMAIARERKGGLSVYLETARHVSENGTFSCCEL